MDKVDLVFIGVAVAYVAYTQYGAKLLDWYKNRGVVGDKDVLLKKVDLWKQLYDSIESDPEAKKNLDALFPLLNKAVKEVTNG